MLFIERFLWLIFLPSSSNIINEKYFTCSIYSCGLIRCPDCISVLRVPLYFSRTNLITILLTFPSFSSSQSKHLILPKLNLFSSLSYSYCNSNSYVHRSYRRFFLIDRLMIFIITVLPLLLSRQSWIHVSLVSLALELSSLPIS